jgi:hypothetical protein
MILPILLNIVTLTIVALFLVFFSALFKKAAREPDVTPTEIMDGLTNGDRLAEVLREPVNKLMTGYDGNFVSSESFSTLPMYMIT